MKQRARSTSIWGPKLPMRDAASVLEEAEECLARLKSLKAVPYRSAPAVRQAFTEFGRSYYSLAALSRRKELTTELREEALSRLFGLRALIEKRMLQSLQISDAHADIVGYALRSRFFGRSIKQGISIRFPLATCNPTTLCAGRCYAHDGRDRDLQRIFRGVLNWYVANRFEYGDEKVRHAVMSALSKSIDDAIAAAQEESRSVAQGGYSRRPRIRFSHVGEMVATPLFTVALAKEIRRRAPEVECVAYTRHPSAHRLIDAALIVNFTVDGQDDPRVKMKPPGARLVSSSWDGKLVESAEVNFIEHHVEKSSIPTGVGQCCPVTLNHRLTPSCDSAHCQRCFVPTN